jgi:NADH dehydrogenase
LVALYLAVRPETESAKVTSELEKKRVVILGGGFGGVSVAKRLEQLYLRDETLEITLISESNYLLFTPMLAEVASSGLEAQHISVPIRSACVHTRFLRAEVSRIDTERRVVVSRSGGPATAEEIPYDHLVLALGSVPHYFGLPGVEEHCFTLKSLEDATRLRNHVIELLEHADSETDPQERQCQLTFVVVGGGLAGTETVAEMFDLVRNVRRFYPNIGPGDPRFVLIHPRERILPELGAQLGEYALRKLEARGIEFLLNSRVTGATAGEVLFNENESPEQQSIPNATLVWTAGNQPHPLLRLLPCRLRPGRRARSGPVAGRLDCRL